MAVSLALSSAVQSASVTNFVGTVDDVTNRIQFSFDINPVDAITPNGVDSLNFDFDRLGRDFIDPVTQPFIPGSRLIFSSIAGATGELFDDDEFIVHFPTLTAPASVRFIVEGIATGRLLSDPSYSMDLYLNVTFGATPSSLSPQLIAPLADQSDFAPMAVVPLPAAVWLFIAALGSLGALRWLRPRAIS